MPGAPDTSLPALVRALREEALLSQDELARRSGLSVGTIRGLEAGRIRKPRGASVRQLAEVLAQTAVDRDRLLAAARGDTVADTVTLQVSPAQLPMAAAVFIGRARELDTLTEAARNGDARPASVATITGTAGIGKTALAVRWAHRAAMQFPDGQLYLDLRGFDPTRPAMSSAEALRTLLELLHVPAAQIPASADAQAGLYRSLLADRRILVMLDNARDAEQVRPLLPGARGTMAVVTSRDRLLGLVASECAVPVRLDTLGDDEAREMLAGRLGTDRVAAEPAAVAAIVTACAGLPLALAMVAARAATCPGFALAVFAAELADVRDRLDALAGPDSTTDMRAVFSWSYDALDPAAARLFRLVGLHPGPDISVDAAASLAGLRVAQVRRLLGGLTAGYMLTEQVPGRYGCHDLLRAYAGERAHAEDTAAERDGAWHRLLDHYLHTAYAADRWMAAARDPIELDPPWHGTIVGSFADNAEARQWLDKERLILVALTERADLAQFAQQVQQLAWALGTYLLWSGLWHQQLTVQRAGLRAACQRGDQVGQADIHRRLAHACAQLGSLADAHEHTLQALSLYRAIGDHAGEARTQLALVWLSEQESRYADALDHARRCLKSARAAGHPVLQALARNALGWCHSLLGEHEEAIVHCEHALAELEELGEPAAMADVWDSLGYACHHLGRYDEAAAHYQLAIDRCRDLGDRRHEATTQMRFGETLQVKGDCDGVLRAWERALEIFDDIGHPNAAAVRERLRRLA